MLPVIRATPAKVVIDPAALAALVNSPNGPVAKELARTGARIEATAKQLLTGEIVNVDTGRLRSSTVWRIFTRNGRIGVAIGSSVDYAEIVHGPFLEPTWVTRNVAGHPKTYSRKGLFGQHRGTWAWGPHTRRVLTRPYLVVAARRNGVRL